MKKLNLFILLFIFISGCHLIDKPNEKYAKILTNNGEKIMLKRINEEFEVKISVEDATDVIGLSAWITYDPAIVEVVDADSGSADTQVIANDLGFLPNAQLLVGVQKDNGDVEQPGTLVCGYVSVPPTPISGDGDCFDVRFRAIAQGTTDIEFAVGHLNLQDLDGEIPTNGENDSVEVPANALVKITVL